MSTHTQVLIEQHTTFSSPRAHIVYIVTIVHVDGAKYNLEKRYSEVRDFA
jgi:hypothetical protein